MKLDAGKMNRDGENLRPGWEGTQIWCTAYLLTYRNDMPMTAKAGNPLHGPDAYLENAGVVASVSRLIIPNGNNFIQFKVFYSSRNSVSHGPSYEHVNRHSK